MYKAVIVEDDPLSAEALSDVIENSFSEIELTASYDSVSRAILGLKESPPDLLFLDMELKDGKGFDVLREIGEISFEVIITTSYESYMLEAIKYSALDYIIKPVQKMELEESLARFKKRMSKKNIETPNASLNSNKLVIPNQEGLILVEIDTILRLESDGPYTTIHLAGGKKKVTSKNLGYYESALSDHSFFRVHHSHLINLNHIVNYIRGDGGQVVLVDGSVVGVSRRKKDDFLSALGA